MLVEHQGPQDDVKANLQKRHANQVWALRRSTAHSSTGLLRSSAAVAMAYALRRLAVSSDWHSDLDRHSAYKLATKRQRGFNYGNHGFDLYRF